jgi:Protein of unknown function (DUF2510)
MQEFESISASSYDPSALATKLTAKAAEGWSVVAIVPTGGDVTAFVTRDKGGATESAKSTASTEPEAKKDEEEESAAPALPAKTDTVAEATIAATADTPSEPKSEPVSEPSGWAIAPEPSKPTTPEPTGVQPTLAASGAAAYTPTTPGTEAVAAGAATPASAAAAATPAAAAAAATPAAAAAPAVPAGWYADPAGRFELRYWDGSTWTEHVSRAGQQFTDPPVA